jgi:hypothetical protein
VPFGFVWLPELLPLHEHMKSNSSGSKRNPRRRFRAFLGRNTKANIAIAQNPGGIRAPERAAASVRDVVVTVTLNVEAEVAVTFTVGGGEQIAPLGAPVQLSETIPAKPPPPIARV